MSRMINIEPHFYATVMACETSWQLLQFLPDSDLIEEVRELMYVQHELFLHILQGRHYGSNALDDFVEYNQSLLEETNNLRDQK